MESNSLEVLSIAAAARRLGVGRSSVQRWIDRGILPSARIGDRPYVRRVDLERLVAPAPPQAEVSAASGEA